VSFATDLMDIGVCQEFKKQEKWKSAFYRSPQSTQSPQSTHRLRNTVAKCSRLSWWYRLKWLFKWSYSNIL